jgi:MFS family permease
VGVAAVLVGGGFAFMHSTLQTWATEVVPEARATVISLFAAALFAGSGLATAAAAPLADDGRFGLLFATAALVAVPLGLFAALARRRYARHLPVAADTEEHRRLEADRAELELQQAPERNARTGERE